jgi:amidase
LVVDTHPAIPSSADVRRVIGDLADHLARAGAKVARQSPLPPDPVEAARLYMRLLLSVMAAGYPSEVYDWLHVRTTELDADDLSLAAERTRGSVLSHRD